MDQGAAVGCNALNVKHCTEWLTAVPLAEVNTDVLILQKWTLAIITCDVRTKRTSPRLAEPCSVVF